MTHPNPLCEYCHQVEADTFEPDPYRVELRNDWTEVWLCWPCHHECLMEI